MTDERLTKVVVGKIHISNWAKSEFDSRLKKLLSTKKKYEQERGKGKDKFYWTFSNFIEDTVEEDEENVIFAQLVKIKKQVSEIVFDEESWSPTRTATESPNASYSSFIIVPKKHLIIFEEQPSISINLFKQMFSSIYAEHFSGLDLSKMWIDPLIEREHLLTRLKEFDKITNIRLIITPSNPDAGDWKTMDPLMKESKIARAILDLDNEEGLNLDGTMIEEAFNLASAGHGSTQSITAIKGDEEQLIIPKDEIKRFRVRYSDDARKFLKILYQVCKSVLRGGGSK